MFQWRRKEIDLALAADMKDFEDAFQYFSAINNAADVIITRNAKDFANAEIPVITAEEVIQNEKHLTCSTDACLLVHLRT